jgi:hypothetical protein
VPWYSNIWWNISVVPPAPLCPCCLLSFQTFPCTISPLFCRLLLSLAGRAARLGKWSTRTCACLDCDQICNVRYDYSILLHRTHHYTPLTMTHHDTSSHQYTPWHHYTHDTTCHYMPVHTITHDTPSHHDIPVHTITCQYIPLHASTHHYTPWRISTHHRDMILLDRNVYIGCSYRPVACNCVVNGDVNL